MENIDSLYVLFLAFIQGVTEFLPISSSAHLILPSHVFGLEDQGLLFDVAAHLGSLLAVMVYFRQDIFQLSQAWLRDFGRSPETIEAKLAWQIIFATIPAVIVGLCIEMMQVDMRSILIIATTTSVFAIVLGVADKLSKHNARQETDIRDAWLIGLLQCLALIPGTSRSGITMTGALLLGLTRDAAARFSFLLSIPLILAASALKCIELIQSDVSVDWPGLILVIALSAVTAWLCIRLFLQWINRIGFMPFVIYRLVLAALLYWLYFTQ